MRFIGDLHIHSHFSLATSQQLAPEFLDLWARRKGISVVGTGDFTHPGWIEELKEKLDPAEPGLFRLKDSFRQKITIPPAPSLSSQVRFVLSAEISSIYKKNGKVRKVHNVILAPDFATVEKIQQKLIRLGGNLTSDGRPILGLDSKDLLELALEASDKIFFMPAHIWTPWFSVLGSKSGFDTVKECFEDLTPHISAVETGLSTDAPMHWVCSFLDHFTLISNSDAHSPEKLGRNANIFNSELSYPGITNAIQTGDPEQFGGTIDLFPQEGKYHYDGHRKCGVCWDPLQTLEHKGICTQCGKKVTVGVMHRVAQLADRKHPSLRPHQLPFASIIPLKEILAEIFETGPASKKVDSAYHNLLHKHGPELYILLDLPAEELRKTGFDLVAEAIERMRDRRVIIQEGYDGEYGRVRVFQPGKIWDPHAKSQADLFGEQEAKDPIPKRNLINFDLGKYRTLYNQQQAAEPSQLSIQEFTPPPEDTPQLPQLNPEQQKAVQHDSGPALILAGPGTGKTRILIHRIAFLIHEKSIAPENILAITFTNKAAGEIKERLSGLSHKGRVPGIEVGTFHAFGYAILKKFPQEIGRQSHPSILDEEDKVRVLKKALGCTGKEAASFASAITATKQNLKTQEDIPEQKITEIFSAYEDYLQRQNMIDFDDCIYQTVKLLRQNPRILGSYQKRFPWILVDEFQDINFAQYHLIKLLKPEPNSDLYVVGDPNQAIYGFRGADVRFLKDYTADYPATVTYRLSQSYRCSDIILKASGNILSRDEPGFLTGLAAGIKIAIAPQASDKSEAEFVARTIEDIIGGLRFFSLDSEVSAGDVSADIESLSDFAVLCRIKNQMPAIEKALNDHSIPYQAISEQPFLRQEPISTVIDTVNWLLNPGNMFLQDKLAEKTINKISDPAALCSRIQNSSVAEALQAVSLNIYGEGKTGSRVEFRHLLELAQDFGQDLDRFLRYAALGSGVDTLDTQMESVHLMTLHAAKGLEFKSVFIIGCEEGLLPYSLFPDRVSDAEEERRLLYVGMTRAQKYVFLTHAQKRFLMGRELHLPRSPFLDHIEKELIRIPEESRTLKKKDPQMKLF